MKNFQKSLITITINLYGDKTMSDITLPSLDDLANKYETDKGSKYEGSSRHGYASFYDTILSKWRHEPIRMMEIGIKMEGTQGGHSVYMWREYFSKAEIYTFDIADMSTHPSIIDKDGVFFFQGDQSKREDFKKMYETFGNFPFDFILEDGSHTEEHQMISLGHLFEYIKPGGFYILEDISIPGNEVCCIRNDKTHMTISEFMASGKFNSEFITTDEKSYLETHISKIELFTDVQDAYMTAIIHKKI